MKIRLMQIPKKRAEEKRGREGETVSTLESDRYDKRLKNTRIENGLDRG